MVKYKNNNQYITVLFFYYTLKVIIIFKEINKMNSFQPFEQERMMSKYEQKVDFNLSESGVHPMLLR